MFKQLFCLALIAVFAAASTNHTLNITNFVDLFEGFNDQLNIENNTDFVNCAQIPFVADLTKTLADLNASKSNPFELITDVMALYADYHTAQANCPKLVAAYEAFFTPAITAFQADPKTAGFQVLQNVLANLKGIETAFADAKADAKGKAFYNLGSDLGVLVGDILNGLVQL